MSRCPFTPVRPKGSSSRLSVLGKYLTGRGNLLTMLNEKMFRGWMGESGVPGVRSFCVNQPELVRRILIEEADDFPKSRVMTRALEPLLGESIFLTNGEIWRKQRRIIDPAFVGGKVRAAFPAMRDASDHMVERFAAFSEDAPVNIDHETTHVTADVIFRTLFSIPITRDDATAVYEAFGRYQDTAPFVSFSLLGGIFNWGLFGANRRRNKAGADIRALILPFIEQRRREIEAGEAPDDLATGIMTTADPVTGDRFDSIDMLNQVAVFFLAGHETSASALSWALYLLANDQGVQDRMREEAFAVAGDGPFEFSHMKALTLTRNVFREAMRLYPPVSFFIRAAARPKVFRKRPVPKGSMVILAPWFLHRHERLWDNPHAFDPDRWDTPNGRERFRDAYIPFSAGPRVCPGASFALQEAAVILASLIRRYRFEPVEGREPEPVMRVTLRAGEGTWLRVRPAARP